MIGGTRLAVCALLLIGCGDGRGLDAGFGGADANQTGVDGGPPGADAGPGDLDAGPGDADAGGPTADPREHCINFAFWECRRDLAAGRIDELQSMECLVPIQDMCESAAWPPGCAPTREQSNACIILMSRSDLEETPTPELLATFDDCDLCP